jgi:hypothetical protein
VKLPECVGSGLKGGHFCARRGPARAVRIAVYCPLALSLPGIIKNLSAR